MTVDGAAILECWERARALPRPWRELTLLELIGPAAGDEPARLPIGERDLHLLDLRTALAGSRIDCETDCPACGERLALELDAQLLRTARPSAERDVRRGRRRLQVRPPNSHDVAACLGAADPELALLQRCTDIGDESPAADVREALARAMATMDPGAEILLDAECPACHERWQVPLDPASLAFEEVQQLAIRLLREVDQLARAYGWRERDVLAMSAERRHAYVALAAQ